MLLFIDDSIIKNFIMFVTEIIMMIVVVMIIIYICNDSHGIGDSDDDYYDNDDNSSGYDMVWWATILCNFFCLMILFVFIELF